MIRIAIIEDESIAARNIERILADISLETIVVAKIESVKEAINILPTINLDLIILDIHLLDGNAFQIFNKIELFVPIIFATAYDNYVLQAFKQLSIDYLLKPIKKSELEIALAKYEHLYKVEKQDNFKLLYELITKRDFKKTFLVQTGKKLRPIKTENIAYFFVENKSIFLRTFNNLTFLSDYSLAQVESQIDPNNFYRVNRQFLINTQAIENIYYESLNKLKVNCKPSFTRDVWVSIDKISKFKKWINS